MRPIDILVQKLPINNPTRIAADHIQDPDLKFCIGCNKYYEPRFKTKEEAQEKGTASDKEQWISGICSDECWDDIMGSTE